MNLLHFLPNEKKSGLRCRGKKVAVSSLKCDPRFFTIVSVSILPPQVRTWARPPGKYPIELQDPWCHQAEMFQFRLESPHGCQLERFLRERMVNACNFFPSPLQRLEIFQRQPGKYDLQETDFSSVGFQKQHIKFGMSNFQRYAGKTWTAADVYCRTRLWQPS